MPEPYYEDEKATLYHGDCREILPGLPTYDLLLTDPPYGIAGIWKGGFSGKHGWRNAGQHAAVRNRWDEAAPDPETLDLLLTKAKHAVIWGGNYFPLPLSRGWLVWNKPERGFTLAEAELAWTSRDMVIRVCDQPRSEPGRQHPTQKPLRLMSWCLNFFPDVRTVVDPYAGVWDYLACCCEPWTSFGGDRGRRTLLRDHRPPPRPDGARLRGRCLMHLCGEFTAETMFTKGGTAMYEPTVGVQRFEAYGPPPATAATVCRDIDDTARQVAELTRENQKLRHEKANALAAAEAERAESARLRSENQALATQLATAKAANTAGSMSP